MFDDAELIDLSIGIEDGPPSEPTPASIDRLEHREGAESLAATLQEQGFDVDAADFPEGMGLAWEEVHAITHTGTHMDAPRHYGPETGGESARTIEEVPLSWCAGEAVVLDLRHLQPGDEISVADLEAALGELDYELTGDELVLLQTGADDLWGSPEYLTQFPGMGRAATMWLLDRGITVIGTDAYGFDKPFDEMGRRFERSGDSEELWPAHFAGREREYCQIEKMANLDDLPRKTGVPVIAQPILVAGGSAGWVRPVAIVEGGAA